MARGGVTFSKGPWGAVAVKKKKGGGGARREIRRGADPLTGGKKKAPRSWSWGVHTGEGGGAGKGGPVSPRKGGKSSWAGPPGKHLQTVSMPLKERVWGGKGETVGCPAGKRSFHGDQPVVEGGSKREMLNKPTTKGGEREISEKQPKRSPNGGEYKRALHNRQPNKEKVFCPDRFLLDLPKVMKGPPPERGKKKAQQPFEKEKPTSMKKLQTGSALRDVEGRKRQLLTGGGKLPSKLTKVKTNSQERDVLPKKKMRVAG